MVLLPTLCKIEDKLDNLPAKTNKIPLTNVRFLLLELQLPTKQTVPPIRRISRLDKGNHVDRLIVTENRKKSYFKGNQYSAILVYWRKFFFKTSQGSKIALVRSYLRVPQSAGQVKIVIFLVKIICFPIYANTFCDAGQVPILRYFEACIYSTVYIV